MNCQANLYQTKESLPSVWRNHYREAFLGLSPVILPRLERDNLAPLPMWPGGASFTQLQRQSWRRVPDPELRRPLRIRSSLRQRTPLLPSRRVPVIRGSTKKSASSRSLPVPSGAFQKSFAPVGPVWPSHPPQSPPANRFRHLTGVGWKKRLGGFHEKDTSLFSHCFGFGLGHPTTSTR